MKQYIEDSSIQGRRAEIEQKVRNLRASMQENGFDAVLINKSGHFAWITAGGDNIVTRYSEGGICSILVTQSARYYICNNIEAQRMIDEEFLDQLGFEARTMDWYENKTQEILQTIVGDGRLASDTLTDGAADAAPMLQYHEKVLCDNEIARYLHMGKVFSEVIESYMTTVRVGDTEKEVAGRLSAKMWENGLEAVLILVAADDRIYKYRHAIPTDKPVEKMLMISCNARYKGLITKISRTIHFGLVPEALKEQHQKTAEIENRMAELTKPGVDDLEAFNLAKTLYAQAGCPEMWKEHHQGGPQSYTNGFYLITERSHDTVRLGQVYGYNPSITGTKTEDAVVVTEDGPIFATYPVCFPKLTGTVNGKEVIRPGIMELKP